MNQLERRIDADSFEILMRYNPSRCDLREVIAGMKVANNLERISARRAASPAAPATPQASRDPEAHLLEGVYEKARIFSARPRGPMRRAIPELAVSLYARDLELDEAHREVIRELSKRMDRESGQVKQILHLIFMVRSLERVGDMP